MYPLRYKVADLVFFTSTSAQECSYSVYTSTLLNLFFSLWWKKKKLNQLFLSLLLCCRAILGACKRIGFNYAHQETKYFFSQTPSTHKSKSTKKYCQNSQDQLLIVNWTCYKRKLKNGMNFYITRVWDKSKLNEYCYLFFSSSGFIANEGCIQYTLGIQKWKFGVSYYMEGYLVQF